MEQAVSFIIHLPGMTPSLASHCWHLFYFGHLNRLMAVDANMRQPRECQ